MVFGLYRDPNSFTFPVDRIVGANPVIDIFWVNKVGGLAVGAVMDVKLAQKSGAAPTRELSENLVGSLRFVRKAGFLEIGPQSVAIDFDQPLRGIDRPWFLCPVCGRRCRFVFLRDVIACRRCHRLDYASRHLNRQMPGILRLEKMRRKLGDCEVRAFAPLPALRRGRSRAYHDKLVAMILNEEAALLGHLQTVTHDLERRARLRGMLLK